jgi:hypothetical protein
MEDWIPTSRFNGLFINHADLTTNNSLVRAWLNYQDYPINWFCNILDDKVCCFHHGETLEILAADPKFFEKLTELINHIIVFDDCFNCKSEVVSNYKNHD